MPGAYAAAGSNSDYMAHYLCRAKRAHTTVATDESLLISFHLLQLIFQTLFGTISVSLAPMHAIIHVTVCAICCG